MSASLPPPPRIFPTLQGPCLLDRGTDGQDAAEDDPVPGGVGQHAGAGGQQRHRSPGTDRAAAIGETERRGGRYGDRGELQADPRQAEGGGG